MIWTLPEVASASGVPYRTLHSWLRSGLVTASVRDDGGSGNATLFSDDDLLRAAILGALRPYLTREGLALIGSEVER